MYAAILSLILVGLGYFFKIYPLIFIGLAAFLLVIIVKFGKRELEKHPPVPAGGPKYKHKLVQADESMWEQQEIWPYMMEGPHGLGMSGVADPFSIVENYFHNEYVARRARDFLPFPNYGRTNIVEHIFVGFPVSIGSILRR